MELTPQNCREYLAARGEPEAARLAVTELGGGVSNRVLLVEGQGRRFVLKQSLDRLRVAEEWLADRSRIFRERQILDDVAALLPAGAVPNALWIDEANFLFAMSAAGSAARTWKEHLLAGSVDADVAARVGTLLGLIIRDSWGSPEMERRYGNQMAFEQLRVDPYYRTVARRRPELAPAIEEIIAQSAARRVSLVHGDFSPKNFLISPGGGVMVIDWEVVHYGDPSFDAAFCLNHLLLKSFRRPEQAGMLLEAARVFYAWTEGLLPPPALEWFEASAIRHLGCLMLARIDGKSPVEYIREESAAQAVRETAMRILREPPDDIEACCKMVGERAGHR